MVGGGTAGHITPLLAVAKELLIVDDSTQVVFVTDKYTHHKDMFPSDKKVVYISAGKWRRFHGHSRFSQFLDFKTQILNARDLVRFARGYIEARALLLKESPDVVFVKGGYVGLPLGLAAARKGIKLVIHDSDVVPGLTNRLLAKHADIIATGFPTEYYPYPKEKTHYTGNVLRSDFSTVDRDIAKKSFSKLREGYKTVLVIGGSHGAEKINVAISSIVDRMKQDYNVIHIVGKKSGIQPRETSEYIVRPYIQNMHEAMAVSDVAITRAGATSVAELATVGLPAIVIPHPDLTGGHQLKNAEVLQEAGAAFILQQSEIIASPETILDALHEAYVHSEKLVQNLKQFSHPGAAHEIAKVLLG